MITFKKELNRREFNKIFLKSGGIGIIASNLFLNNAKASEPGGEGQWSISYGTWHNGWIVRSVYLESSGLGFFGYRSDDHRWGHDIMVDKIRQLAQWGAENGFPALGI